MTELRAAGALTGARRSLLLRGAAAVALLVLATGSLGCSRLVERFQSKQKIREGNAYFKENMYEDALRKYEEAQALDPGEIRIHKFVAMANMAIYNPGSEHEKDVKALETAISNFKTYLAAHPEDEKAAKYLVTTYMNAKRYDDAIAYFEGWLQQHVGDKQAVQTIAMLHAKKGDFDKSMEWQEKLSQVDSENAEVFYTMGVTCWDKAYNTPPDQMDGEQRKVIVDKGMKALERATQLRVDYFEAMLYVGLLYREYGKMATDPVQQEQFLAQANEWQKKALEARARALQKQREEDAARNPLEAL